MAPSLIPATAALGNEGRAGGGFVTAAATNVRIINELKESRHVLHAPVT